MLTLGDVVLPELSVDYSAYLEKDKYTTFPLFTRNVAEENAKLELELKNISSVFEESKTKEVITQKEVENISDLYAQKMKELEIVVNSKKELELLIKDIEDSKSKEELESLENAK
ncbi:hypothetical protein V9T40_012636 [Parthenolecanium corni]|uniref:Uncharacterized protein n=1 Tax=Parthenolecanium corni TaxID=536013 RepID=A0AAN9T841_9HEMI